ncbi:MAG: hypothetical protein ACREV4_02580 [Gammaproteobacteria bacterium]
MSHEHALITQAPKQTPNAIVLALNAVKAARRITAPVDVLDKNDGNLLPGYWELFGVLSTQGQVKLPKG